MSLLDISTWWDGLTMTQAIYWGIAIISSVVLVILLTLNLFVGDLDADAIDTDMEVDTDAGIGFQFISLKNIVGFFTVFGWTGLAMIDRDFSLIATILVSTLAGLLMMVVMASIFYFMMKLAEDGTLNMKNAVGRHGEVYLIVPGGRRGMGKVQINVQGSLRELDAMTDEEEDLSSNTIVKVLEIIDDHILLVSRAGK